MSTAAARVVTTAFGVSGATNNVKMTQFIQEVVAPRIFERTKVKTVFDTLVNHDYEGIVKGKGDQVRIFDVGPIHAMTYAGGTVLSPGTGAVSAPATRGTTLSSRGQIVYQTLNGNAMVVTVTEGDYWAFEVEDIEQFVSNPKYVNKVISNSADSLAFSKDKWVWKTMLAASTNATANEFGFKGGSSTAGSGYGLSLGGTAAGGLTDASANALYYKLVDLATAMDDELVPEDGRWIVLPSFAKGLLLKSSLFVGAAAAGSQGMRDKGYLGDIAGFKVKTVGRKTYSDYSPADASGNMYTDAAGAEVAYANGEVLNDGSGNIDTRSKYRNVDGILTVVAHDASANHHNTFYYQAGHNDAFTLIDAYTKNEQIRLEGSFADAWRGMQVYGGKAVRPNWLFSGTIFDTQPSLYNVE